MAVASSSNPITSVAPSSSPITSVPDSYPPSYQPSQQQLLARLTLEMRGERFVVDRETLLNLPESVLLGMFPNGLILSRQQLGWPDEEDDGENQVYPIDVSRLLDRDLWFRKYLVWLAYALIVLLILLDSISFNLPRPHDRPHHQHHCHRRHHHQITTTTISDLPLIQNETHCHS